MRRFIYGCGFLGKILCNLLLQNEGGCDGLLVSDGYRELEKYTLWPDNNKINIPVFELSEIEVFGDDKIYITVEAGCDTVIKNLLDKGFSNTQLFVVISKKKEIFDVFFKNFYKYYNINLENEYFELGQVKVYNFIRKYHKYEDVFRGTIGDEILPGVYGDNSLAIDGPYEMYKVKIEKDDVVFDIGANMGLFACYAAMKGAKVIACDPDTRCIKVLKEQEKLYPNFISVLPIGLSDTTGKVSFYESEDCALSSFSLIRGKNKRKEIQIDTIDNLVESGKVSKIDYIKADIEGAERDMLRGAVNTLRTQSPKLSICTYHYSDDPIVLENIIRNANPKYTIKHAWRKLYAWVDD